VPYLDYILYRDPSLGRIALNIGGIANLTAIPANAALERIIAFDTGPGNMVIDALTEDLFKKPFDRDGKVAASGHVLEDVISSFLRESYFRLKPPKTTGREEFGREFARQFRRVCGSPNPLKGAKGGAATLRDLGAGVVPDALVRGGRTMAFAPTQPSSRDAIATATALTVRSIGDAVNRFVLPRGSFFEVIASGGGTKNPTLMAWLANELGDSGLRLRSSDEFGIPSEAKEAIAFAVLAFETWNRRPSNVPSATGARRGAVLGKISFP